MQFGAIPGAFLDDGREQRDRDGPWLVMVMAGAWGGCGMLMVSGGVLVPW